MRPRPSGRGEPLSGHEQRDGLQCGRASMRPRPSGRGEPSDPGPWRTKRTDRTVSATASMRPRPRGRGEPPIRRRWHLAIASMRPRPSGRGELLTDQRHRPIRDASMRPRPSGRGERNPLPAIERCREGFNAATARSPWRTRRLWTLAQEAFRFNAATARSPWRT